MKTLDLLALVRQRESVCAFSFLRHSRRIESDQRSVVRESILPFKSHLNRNQSFSIPEAAAGHNQLCRVCQDLDFAYYIQVKQGVGLSENN
jgi:hypothetical protein